MRVTIIAAAALALSAPAHAWNKPGHMATAAIAFHQLKGNAPLVAALATILKAHPDYETTWKALAADGATQNIPEAETLLMLAARWPDDSPDGHTGQKGEWHYINIPLSFDGTPTKPAKPNNLVASFADRLKEFQTAPSTAEGKVQKAIALCWILHQIGDAHQPLHSVALFGAQFRGNSGDQGGNLFYVRYSPGAATYRLHAIWDDALTTSYDLRTLDKLALTLTAENPRTRFARVGEAAPSTWIDESAALAKTVVYQNGTLLSGPNKSSGEVLPSGYAQQRGMVGKERGTLAGYRMADWLTKNVATQ